MPNKCYIPQKPKTFKVQTFRSNIILRLLDQIKKHLSTNIVYSSIVMPLGSIQLPFESN